MRDSIIVVAIFMALILIFVYPIMTITKKNDDKTTVSIQNATEDFVNQIRTTGNITKEDYDKFILTLEATGNSYNVDITVQKTNEKLAKKNTNEYYSMYTTQVLEAIKDEKNNNTLKFQSGDIVSVNVENANITIPEKIRNFIYKISGNNEPKILASYTGLVI